MRPWWLRIGLLGRHQWSGIVALVGLTGFSVAMDAGKPWPLKLIVDYVLPAAGLPDSVAWLGDLPGGASSVGLLAWLAAASVVLFLGSWAGRLVSAYIQAGVGSRMTYELGGRLFEHIQELSLSFHSRQKTGDLVRRVTSDCSCIRQLLVDIVVPLLTSLASLAAMAAILWQLDRKLTLVALGVVPLMIFAIVHFARPMAERASEEQALQGKLISLAEQNLSALPVVKAFGREEFEQRRFSTLARSAGRAYQRVIDSQLQFEVSTSTVTAAGMAVVMALGGLAVLSGRLTLGSLLVFLSYVASLYSPLEALACLSSNYATAKASALRVLEVLEAEAQVCDLPGALPMPERPESERGHVILENVTFGYESGRPVLLDVNLEIRPGESVALVGPSGAGKSTLAALLLRLHDPWQGRVIIDGIDIRGAQLASLRSKIGVVLQEPFLLPVSIAENIAYGRPGASRVEIEEAARAAHADLFIRNLPKGYQTIIGDHGATLSGGERQRLAIARALLRNASILILDEPTAALDAETEAAILQTLDNPASRRTAFIIAHRLSTIRGADRICVLSFGRIVESGTHDSLLLNGRLYHSMYTAQFPGRVVPKTGPLR